ncbi:MAG: alkaline phosphatase [Chthoniobacter sp.]|jgi:alkaline phosphatase|nr:alkaline phosphatase [Chthoniobacter sp.]
MKLRNQLLALFCLLVFAGFGFLYVTNWVVQKPFGIILFVSDGLIARHLTAARLYEGGGDHRLAIEALPHVALLNNSARDFAVPDAAAAATAIATGEKANHRTLAIDARGQPLPTILDLARSAGRSTGLVTNGPLTSPATAAFYAHTADARDSAGIALQFVSGPLLQVAFGGGAAHFLPPAKGGQRADERDLLGELQANGRELVRTKAALEDATSYRATGLVGLFSAGPMAFSNQIESGSEQPSLSDMVRRAIECLQTNRKGYVLVVDATLLSTAAERNEGEHVITETLALDRAIATALRYAGEKALIVAVGRHATGGMSLNGYPLRQDHGVALLGTNASGQPAITWATGPNGPSPNLPPAINEQPEPANPVALPTGAKKEPAAFQTPSALNTAEDVLAVGTGPGSERLQGFRDSTAIFRLLKDAL